MRAAKLHGAGNDFLLFDGGAAVALEVDLPGLVPRLCHRRLGLGADGVLLVIPSAPREARLVYWNADGSEASFCANGTRCAARFAAARWGWSEMLLHTGFAPVPARVSGRRVELDLPVPAAIHSWQDLEVAGEVVRGRYLVVGVPHLIVPVDWSDFSARPILPLAPALRHHRDLPAGGANVTFIQVCRDILQARSFERGLEAETLSCGSGNVAAGLVAMGEGWMASPVRVATASGRELVVIAAGRPPACPSRLAGPAEWVADLEISDELLTD